MKWFDLWRMGIALLGAALLPACGGPAEIPFPPSPDRSVIIDAGSGERHAHVHHPASAAAGAPLVVVLHAAGSSAAESRERFGWDALADRAGFVVAYPDGLHATWNAGRCCGRSVADDVDDLGYLDTLTTRLSSEDRIDQRRVYAVGISNGGMMAYSWACSRPGELAGIGVVAAARVDDCPTPAPLTVVAIHGTADPIVPLAGGPGLQPGNDFPSLDESLAPFRRAATCPREPESTRENLATVTSWRCRGATVVQDVLQGTPHVWPGSGPAAGTDDGPEDATGFLWNELRAARS